MKEGERGPFFPKLRVRIKDNNSSPHGKFHRFSFPFSCKFPDLNFASYVLYIYLCGTHSEPGLPLLTLPVTHPCLILSLALAKRSRRKSKPAKLPLDHSSVINLSNSILSPDEISVLARGLTSDSVLLLDTSTGLKSWPTYKNDFARRVRLTEYVFDENTPQ